MDIQMPLMDGIESTKIIRRTLNYTSPIVALTAFADESNRKACEEAGVDYFLSKPVRISLVSIQFLTIFSRSSGNSLKK